MMNQRAKVTEHALPKGASEAPADTLEISERGEASPRPMTVLFTDIVGSSRFFDRFGDPAGRRLLAQHARLVSRAVAAGGGTVVKTIGDSVMAFFEDPDAAVSSAIRVQRAVRRFNDRRVTDRQMRLRIAVHHGEGIVEADDIFGSVVNFTAKLLPLASADEILVSGKLLTALSATPGGVQPARADEEVSELNGEKLFQIPWDEAADNGGSFRWWLHMRAEGSGWDGQRIETMLRRREAMPLEIVRADRHGELLWALSFETQPAALAAAGVLLDTSRREELAPPRLVLDLGRLSADNGIPGLFVGEDMTLLPSGELLIAASARSRDTAGGEQLTALASRGPLASIFRRSAPAVTPMPKDHQSADSMPGESVGPTLDPCFHCGQRWHTVGDCPSHALVDAPLAVHRLGYESIEDIERLGAVAHHDRFTRALSAELQESGNLTSRQLASMALLELHFCWQIRALRAVWGAPPGGNWDGIRRVEGVTVDGGPLWLALECFRAGDCDGLQRCCAAWNGGESFRFLVLQALGQIARGESETARSTLKQALKLTGNPNQASLLLLWLSRLAEQAGDSLAARGHLRETLVRTAQCPEALYSEMGCKLRNGSVASALADLSCLVENDREYFVYALIDPQLAPFRQPIATHLRRMMSQCRESALKALPAAEAAVQRLAMLWGPDLPEVTALKVNLQRARAMVDQESYYGFRDLNGLCQSIAAAVERILADSQRRFYDRLHWIGAGCMELLHSSAGHARRSSVKKLHVGLHTILRESDAIKRCMREETPQRFSRIGDRLASLEKELEGLARSMRRLQEYFAIQAFTVALARKLFFFELLNLLTALVVMPLVAHYAAFLLPELALQGAALWQYQKAALFAGGAVAAVLAVIGCLKPNHDSKTCTMLTS